MQPFDKRILLLLCFGGISYLGGYLIPELNNFIYDLIVRSSVTALIFIFLVLKVRISPDMNDELNRILRTNFF